MLTTELSFHLLRLPFNIWQFINLVNMPHLRQLSLSKPNVCELSTDIVLGRKTLVKDLNLGRPITPHLTVSNYNVINLLRQYSKISIVKQ